MTRARDLVVNASTVLAALSALAVAGVAIRREFSHAPTTPPPSKLATVDNWRDYAEGGHRIGPQGTEVTIIEFGDFECPACRAFARTAAGVLGAHSGEVALVFRHWPLPYHKLAYPAAKAAECAAEQGRFTEYHGLLYAHQDSLGLIPFVGFAKRAGVGDLAGFERCIERQGRIPAIEADIAAARKLNARGTPTVLVNGLQPGSVPDSIQLEELIAAARK